MKGGYIHGNKSRGKGKKLSTNERKKTTRTSKLVKKIQSINTTSRRTRKR